MSSTPLSTLLRLSSCSLYESYSLYIILLAAATPVSQQKDVILIPSKVEEWDPVTNKQVGPAAHFPTEAYFSFYDTTQDGNVIHFYFSRDLGVTQVLLI